MTILKFRKIRQADRSPTTFQSEIKRKGLTKFYESCCMCGWNKANIDLTHFVPHKDGGKYNFSNILPLCPNHHRQWDRDILNECELESIQFFLWNIMMILDSKDF